LLLLFLPLASCLSPPPPAFLPLTLASRLFGLSSHSLAFSVDVRSCPQSSLGCHLQPRRRSRRYVQICCAL
jgi:hypothetical protein